MVSDFVVGQIYNRRQDIHDRFGGQRQSGIVTPSEYPAVFTFTGRGTPHGYADEWSADGTFRYFGEISIIEENVLPFGDTSSMPLAIGW